MGTMKIRTPHLNKEGRVFSWTSLLYGFSLGVLMPIFPTFVEMIIKEQSFVGYFYSAMSIAMIISGLLASYIFRKLPRMTVLYISLAVISLTTIFFAFINQFYQLFPFEFIRVSAELLVLTTLGLMLKDFTAAKNLGKTEGVFFLFNNIGWFLGPITGGVVAKYGGFEAAFVLSGLIMIVSLFYILHQHLVKRHPFLSLPAAKAVVNKGENNFKLFIKNGGRIGAYLVALALVIWFSFHAIALPLFVEKVGYGSDMSGLILSLSMLPLIIFEAGVGTYADKHGFKKPIVLGFFIIAFCMFTVKFSPSFLLATIFFILASVGVAFIEPLYNYYFFKNVSRDEEDRLYGIFMTASPVARFIGPAILSTSLVTMPFEWVFVVFGIIFMAAGGFSFMIKEK
jgi:DHA1 family multidrug resistance protein-like MFS transporter